MARKPLLPKRRPRTPSRAERTWGVILLVILAFVVGLFFASGSGAGPRALPERTAALPPLSPGGWPWSDVGHYDASTLFEKINGKADAYLVYDFRSLDAASYASPDAEDVFVDAYLYDMGSSLDAFGVYRAQRGDAPGAADVGEEGCSSGGGIYFRRGKYYAEVTPSGEAAVEEAEALARKLAELLPASTEPVQVPSGFAEDGLVTVRFDREGALGVEGLRDAFVAVYEDGTRIVVATCETVEAAAAAAAEAAESLPFLGDPATFEVLGLRVVGVAGPKDEARRRALVEPVLDALRGGAR